jgi:hypothetical protein
VIKVYSYMDSTPGRKGQKVSSFGPGAVVLASPGSIEYVGILLRDVSDQGAEVEVECPDMHQAEAPAVGRARVERNDLTLHQNGVKIAPTRDDELMVSHVQGELLRVLLLATRLLGQNWSIKLPDGRDLMKVELPEDVAIAWDTDLHGETARLISLVDASHPRFFKPTKWPTPPAPCEPEPEPYAGPMSNLLQLPR